MVGDGLIEDGAATEDGATAEVGTKLRTKESDRWWVSPPAGSSKWGSQASDAVRIDNEIIDSIFRMNSGGDDDRWVITNPTAGHDTYTSFEGVLLWAARLSM